MRTRGFNQRFVRLKNYTCGYRRFALAMLVAAGLLPQHLSAADSLKITVYGASGSIGSRIVAEALIRGHEVRGVSRSAEKLEGKHEGLEVVEGNVLEVESIRETIAGQDIVIVAINDDRDITDPSEHAVHLSAVAVSTAARELGHNAPRVIQVLGAATLVVQPGVLMIDTMGLEPGSGPYVLINGHKMAWDTYHQSPDIKWTIATPSRYIEAGERTGTFRWSGVEALRNAEDKLTNISIEDFALAIVDEAENGNYMNRQFTVGY
jgi:putative NADH-flavin reductase